MFFQSAELEQQWCKEQELLRAQIIDNDSMLGFQWPPLDPSTSSSSSSLLPPLRLIGGMDISFYDEHDARALAALCILEYPSMKVRSHK